MSGLPLFDRYTKAEKEEAIARVDAHADPAWKEAAFQAVYRVARKRPTLSVDDVWRELGTSTPLPHELRAIGGVMRRAKNAGIISSTDRSTPSQLGASRWNVPVWTSNVFSITTDVPTRGGRE